MSVMVMSLTIDLVVPEGVPMVFYAREIHQSRKNVMYLDVHLVNGTKKTEGRFELCAYGYWSDICNDYSPSLSYLLECVALDSSRISLS